MQASQKVSPMMEQYRRIKKQYEGNILFFRLGDFYEMFGEDAVEVSSLLNIVLTSRNGVPMCGVPYHAAKTYIARLLKLGKKIAMCEQLTAPEKGVKVVERDVVEIITPGTTVDEDFLEKGSANYLGCLASVGTVLSFSYIDLSTGDFFATFFSKNQGQMLRQELQRVTIKELIIQESLLEEDKDNSNSVCAAIYERSDSNYGGGGSGSIVLNRHADWLFDPAAAKQRLEKQFGLANLKSFGLEEGSPEIVSAGALFDYIDTTQKTILPHIKTIKVYHDLEYLGLDESTQRNLELLYNQRDGGERFSLFEVLNETRCSMGRRLLKRRLLHPLRDLNKINNRLDIVEHLYRDQNCLGKIRELLGKTPDLQRLCSRLAMDKAHSRDMLAVKNSIVLFREVSQTISGQFCFESDDIGIDGFDSLENIQALLEKAITEEPSVALNEGNLIKTGFNEELDTLCSMRDNSRQILEEYLEEEKLITGIPTLKIRYNRLIGYFFEVTKVNLSRVPKHFIRRQGIAGGERFTTDRLGALESEINGASDKIIELEKKLFLEIREETKKRLFLLLNAAQRLAEIDAAGAMAKAASIRCWTRPQLNESGTLEIYEGRHPVVEAHLSRGEYIPNDILLSTGEGEKKGEQSPLLEAENEISFAMITGPNMAGKSTYLRSAALITIMAQMGSFVPAREASVGLCDRVYCRVGASDNLARGESTFLVEMNETAFILNTATQKSLVIMDEVGRGTGTNDGLSIAWAVSEELLNRIKCRTLFATHFHELSLISNQRMANRSMEVLEQGEKIVFLRKLKNGPTAESYGIHVARLAGLSREVLERAGQIMALLKARDVDLSGTFGKNDSVVNLPLAQVNDSLPKDTQKTKQKDERFEEILKSIDPEQMTPLEALNILCQWKKMALAGVDIDNVKIKQSKNAKPDNSAPSLFD
ncbi:MAG: DNA mismatch repair protein MutS [Treponema sp.]|nr:DNA mismatch repair protein MutS [Treponema sp.]